MTGAHHGSDVIRFTSDWHPPKAGGSRFDPAVTHAHAEGDGEDVGGWVGEGKGLSIAVDPADKWSERARVILLGFACNSMLGKHQFVRNPNSAVIVHRSVAFFTGERQHLEGKIDADGR